MASYATQRTSKVQARSAFCIDHAPPHVWWWGRWWSQTRGVLRTKARPRDLSRGYEHQKPASSDNDVIFALQPASFWPESVARFVKVCHQAELWHLTPCKDLQKFRRDQRFASIMRLPYPLALLSCALMASASWLHSKNGYGWATKVKHRHLSERCEAALNSYMGRFPPALTELAKVEHGGVQQSATQKFLQNRCLPATRSQGVLQAEGGPCSEAGPQDSHAKVKQFVSNTKFSEVFSL